MAGTGQVKGWAARRGWLRGLAAAVVGTVVGSSLLVAVRVAPAGAAEAVPDRKVWVQGDSVMLGAQDDVRADLAGQWSVTVGAFGGLQLVAALDVFRQHLADLGSVVVVELGNNLIGSPEEFGQQMDQAMQIFGDRHVIWLTTALFESRQEAVNQQIWAAAGRWSNLEVLDWAAEVQQHPDATGGDGLHLSGSGRALMAGLIRDRLDGWYRPFAGPVQPAVPAYGGAAAVGPPSGMVTAGAVAGLAATPSGQGYWLAESDGGVFSYGDAPFFGSAGGTPLDRPVVGMAATPDGGGSWLVAADGGIFAFGEAGFFGSSGAIHIHRPVEAMAAVPDGAGYWMVGADGGVFAFGDARFFGSAAGRPGLYRALAARPQGDGYWVAGELLS